MEAVRRAIDKTGRPMVLSLSPGATDIKAAAHVAAHANLWRISDDLWDRWLSVRDQFARLALWNQHRIVGAWPDADMLPLGTLVLGQRGTRLTVDEQITLMTLWSIARSPLMYGGDMTKLDELTMSLLTNDEVLAINQRSTGNRPLFDHDGLVAWTAEDPGNGDKYLAVFNERDRVRLDESNARQPAAVITPAADSVASIDTDVTDGRRLFLLAMPLSDIEGFLAVRWQNPRFVFADGNEHGLDEFPWVSADALWDSATFKKGSAGQASELRAQPAALVEYAVPAGARRFRASARLERPNDHETQDQVRVLTVVGTESNEDKRPGLPVEVALDQLGIIGEVKVRDLWKHADLGTAKGRFTPEIPFHGARLFRLSSR